jgi:sterol desaturase/sphingolipid hydroxylase (fatty acid hydroxylase superfamily)
MVPLATMATAPIAGYLPRLTPLIGVWLPLRVVAFYAVADLGSYWVHRWLHTRHLWRLHRWHHSPTQMYWLAGVRSTIPQQILFNLPFILASPLLIGLPPWVMPLVIIETVVRNDWMHMNVSWRSNWLERVLVTPRYHHLHHSADAELHNGNYGSLLTIWDRMFGTFIDPDLTVPKAFGTGEKQRDPVLLMIGI